MTSIQPLIVNAKKTIFSLAHSIEKNSVLTIFASPNRQSINIELLAALGCERCTVWSAEHINFLLIDGLSQADLKLIRAEYPIAFIQSLNSSIAGFPDDDLLQQLPHYRFKVFCSFSAERLIINRLNNYSLISRKEFLLSDYARLASYPALDSQSPRSSYHSTQSPVTTLFILDLIQDFEILRALILRAALPYSPLKPVVAISNRIIKHGSYLLKEIMNVLETFNISWFTPSGPVDIANALSGKQSALITASESNAAAHALSHKTCLIAPPGTIKITIQHGYECIGLRHHRSHDYAFRVNPVRFASDYILTWADEDQLPNLHPMERHKCIPVGVVKQFAEDVSVQLESGDFKNDSQSQKDHCVYDMLVAENLHSVRFSHPSKYQRLLNFINDANVSEQVKLTIRSHPAARTLELKPETKDKYRFLSGALSFDRVALYDALISPPSTILLDAAMAGVPAFVWSDNSLTGDAVNYDGLLSVADFADLQQVFASSLAHQQVSNFAWALRNTKALNGTPKAWNTILRLLNV
ncbi:hypothetical protein [Methylocucumis oryzae]|uniref:Uncharacterized protein n=1 Tax=Methylocucumis oryzae TaxID=1632867 RepID=A0A0F3IM07_9GAMM|nr:hypothetical protein [Methylocucumis oryzae]KJV07697.1 hypothetical protein VZ94_02870 [Methylocucumis oryzae]